MPFIDIHENKNINRLFKQARIVMSLGYSKRILSCYNPGVKSTNLFICFWLSKIITNKWLNLLFYFQCKERMYFYVKICSCKRRDTCKKVKFIIYSLHCTSVLTEDGSHAVVPHSSDYTETFKLRNWVKLLQICLSESTACLKEGDLGGVLISRFH